MGKKGERGKRIAKASVYALLILSLVILCVYAAGCYRVAGDDSEQKTANTERETVSGYPYPQNEEELTDTLGELLLGTWLYEDNFELDRKFETDRLTFLADGRFERVTLHKKNNNLALPVSSWGVWSTEDGMLELITMTTPYKDIVMDEDMSWTGSGALQATTTILLDHDILYLGAFIRLEGEKENLDGTWQFVETQSDIVRTDSLYREQGMTLVHQMVIQGDIFDYSGFYNSFSKSEDSVVTEESQYTQSGTIWQNGSMIFCSLPNNVIHLDAVVIDEILPIGIRVSKNVIAVTDTPLPIPEENGYIRID